MTMQAKRKRSKDSANRSSSHHFLSSTVSNLRIPSAPALGQLFLAMQASLGRHVWRGDSIGRSGNIGLVSHTLTYNSTVTVPSISAMFNSNTLLTSCNITSRLLFQKPSLFNVLSVYADPVAYSMLNCNFHRVKPVSHLHHQSSTCFFFDRGQFDSIFGIGSMQYFDMQCCWR